MYEFTEAQKKYKQTHFLLVVTITVKYCQNSLHYGILKKLSLSNRPNNKYVIQVLLICYITKIQCTKLPIKLFKLLYVTESTNILLNEILHIYTKQII